MPSSIINLDNFGGGWNANEATIIDDDQLAVAENWFYDENALLRSRAGTAAFSAAIPDDSILVHNMDTFDGNGTWALDSVTANDAINVATQAAGMKRGAGAVEFDIDVSASVNDFAIITNSTLTGIDLSSAADTGTMRFWINFPDAVTNLTNVRLRWGSAVGAYYESTVTAQINAVAFATGWNLLSFDWATATTTGVPDDTSVDYLQIKVTYAVAQVDMANVLVDNVTWNSATSTKAVLGIETYTQSDAGAVANTQLMVAHVGDVLWNYNETQNDWDPLITGLQEIRGQYAIYKDILYLVNGTDYVSYDGVATAQEATPEKVKYLIVINDIAYGAGVDGAQSTLYYSNGAPASLKIAFSNSDPIDQDNGQIITGLKFIGNFVYVFKSGGSMYKYDASGPVYAQIDKNIGTKGFRSIVNVNNNLLFQGEDGHIYNSFVQETANARTKADSLSADLDPYIDTLKNYAVTAAFEVKELNHVYFSVDEDGSGSPTGMLVLNTKLSSLESNKGVFTRYIGITANDFTRWKNTAGENLVLVANSFGGQVIQMERGLDDQNAQIAVDLRTKAFEFNDPTIVKFTKNVDGIFHATDGATFDFDVIGDDSDSTIGGAVVSVDQASSQSSSLGTTTIGTQTLGGTAVNGLRRFKRRLPTYNQSDKIQIRISDLLASHNLVLEKIILESQTLGRNVFATDSVL